METKMQRLDEEAERSMMKMRILCDVCEKRDAKVICCADEAALCSQCDVEIHEANKLANKHQRVPLMSSIMNSPTCDICQEKVAYFFCMEDRALLCRNCDLSVHTVNEISSNHQRFLMTGTQVALNALETQESPHLASRAALYSFGSFGSRKASAVVQSKALHSCTKLLPQFKHPNENSKKRANLDVGIADSGFESKVGNASRKTTIAEFLTETVPGWRVDELLNLSDFQDDSGLDDTQSIKPDFINCGGFDWVANTCLFDEDVPSDSFHEVPKMMSSPTTFALSRSKRVAGSVKTKSKHEMASFIEYDTMIVPDLVIRSPQEPPYFGKKRKL